MAATSRVLRTMKPHIPLISFHPRQQAGKVTSSIPAAATSKSQPAKKSEKGSGLDFLQLPSRFQRKPLSQEEMEFIERGGPD
ncbi:28S ribosomal protein S36, mitochondrial-like [Gigantopelta aegis]|uniref:28S ribosomal protein S36, mitochondrial-like n=1 Tax=Gigantopelta aegis TaxID=1735272 RepID=UPI001B88DCD9|nr:28S ribosomal protein S36, mitochondrial-like [Gigantopelta aegis]